MTPHPRFPLSSPVHSIDQIRTEAVITQTEVVSALWAVYQHCHTRYALDDLNSGWTELRRLLDERMDIAGQWPDPMPSSILTNGGDLG